MHNVKKLVFPIKVFRYTLRFDKFLALKITLIKLCIKATNVSEADNGQESYNKLKMVSPPPAGGQPTYNL